MLMMGISRISYGGFKCSFSICLTRSFQTSTSHSSGLFLYLFYCQWLISSHGRYLPVAEIFHAQKIRLSSYEWRMSKRENVVSSIKKHVNDLIFRDTCERVFVLLFPFPRHLYTHYEPTCNMFFLNSLFSASPYKQDVLKIFYKLRTFYFFLNHRIILNSPHKFFI